jgi:hypothetical protein
MPRSRAPVPRVKHGRGSKKRQPEHPREPTTPHLPIPPLPVSPSQTTSQVEPIGSRLERVNSMDLPELQRLVEDGFQPDNIDLQEDIILCAMRRLLKGREPRYQQVRSLRRLVYRLGDTMLIAKTGFGKTIIFQAYSRKLKLS